MGGPLVQVSDDVADDPRLKSSANANVFATPNDRRKSAVLNADGSEAAEQADQAQSDKPPQVLQSVHACMSSQVDDCACMPCMPARWCTGILAQELADLKPSALARVRRSGHTKLMHCLTAVLRWCWI